MRHFDAVCPWCAKRFTWRLPKRWQRGRFEAHCLREHPDDFAHWQATREIRNQVWPPVVDFRPNRSKR